MQTFTGFEYVLIDIANNFGLDKKLFEERINWTVENEHKLESLIAEADSPIAYEKSVRAFRDIQAGKPTGYMVSMDACTSGMQIMAATVGCEKTANMTGLIDPNRRADAYTQGMKEMNSMLGIQMDIPRTAVKQAMMTFFYGSQKQPKLLFGEDTEELAAFYKMLEKEAPGAYSLMHTLLDTWQPNALSHDWVMPDGFEVKCPVMAPVDTKIEVDELDHATFTFRFYKNQPQDRGLSNAANIVHSIDGLFVREMNRRCNYKKEKVFQVLQKLGGVKPSKYCDTFVSMVLMDEILTNGTQNIDNKVLKKLKSILLDITEYEPFELVAIHDCFRCHPNNMNHIRYWYKELLADVSESDIMENILCQVVGRKGKLTKYKEIGEKIRQSNYTLS